MAYVHAKTDSSGQSTNAQKKDQEVCSNRVEQTNNATNLPVLFAEDENVSVSPRVTGVYIAVYHTTVRTLKLVIKSIVMTVLKGSGGTLKPCNIDIQCDTASGLTCQNGFCVCPEDKYWKDSRCNSLEGECEIFRFRLFKTKIKGSLEEGSINKGCNVPEHCNQMVGLTCILGRCKCAKHSKWNGFYCTIDGN
ncbi:hypothetical protein ACOME3_007063 [Neoechinorhynchus agilis]